MYYKVEAYTASEQAGKILYDNNITPVYVSDNPVLNAQHVVFEAAKGYRYGLPYHAAMASVTSAPAELLGMGERIGKIKNGFEYVRSCLYFPLVSPQNPRDIVSGV